jgi:hypothetical protein
VNEHYEDLLLFLKKSNFLPTNKHTNEFDLGSFLDKTPLDCLHSKHHGKHHSLRSVIKMISKTFGGSVAAEVLGDFLTQCL